MEYIFKLEILTFYYLMQYTLITKVDHVSKLKSIMNYTTHKNVLAYESFQVFCQCMSEVTKWDIFHDVLDFEDVRT